MKKGKNSLFGHDYYQKFRRLHIDWYKKEISADRILNFNSCHPKLRLVLIFLRKRISILLAIFGKKCDYPRRIIKSLTIKYLFSTLVEPGALDDNNNNDMVSEPIGNIMKGKIDGLNIAYKPVSTIKQRLFSNPKDKISKENTINL